MKNLQREKILARAKSVINDFDLKPSQISDWTYVDQSNISKMQSGKRKVENCSFDTICDIAGCYGRACRKRKLDQTQASILNPTYDWYDNAYHLSGRDISIICDRIDGFEFNKTKDGMWEDYRYTPQMITTTVLNYMFDKYGDFDIADVHNILFKKNDTVRISFSHEKEAKKLYADICKDKSEFAIKTEEEVANDPIMRQHF